MNIDKRIIEFIKEHHVLTLATAVEGDPHACNCFYAFSQENMTLICTSDKSTKHIQQVEKNNFVAGSIVLETMNIGKVQGIQFYARMYEAKDEKLKKFKKIYLKRFPFAVLTNATLWAIELTYIKMTDNRLGFGKKLIWSKETKQAE